MDTNDDQNQTGQNSGGTDNSGTGAGDQNNDHPQTPSPGMTPDETPTPESTPPAADGGLDSGDDKIAPPAPAEGQQE